MAHPGANGSVRFPTMRFRDLPLLSFVALLLCPPGLAAATLVTVEYEGVVTAAFGLGPGLQEGDTFSGTYTYDDAAGDPRTTLAAVPRPDGPALVVWGSSIYEFIDVPGAGATITGGGLDVSNFLGAHLPLSLLLTDDSGSGIDRFELSSVAVPTIFFEAEDGRFDQTPAQDEITLQLGGAQLFHPFELTAANHVPISEPDLSKATGNFFRYSSGGEFAFHGYLTGIALVPEPPTALLLLLPGLLWAASSSTAAIAALRGER